MSKKPYKPVVGQRASIATWSMQVRFLVKEQQAKFVKLLLNEEVDYDVRSYLDWCPTENRNVYWVEISTMSWANNLVRVGELMKKVDYRD